MAVRPLVGIVTGSASDLDVVKPAVSLLEAFGVSHEVRVISAHRTPERAVEYGRKAAGRGVKVVIAVAGMAAHLAGTLAAWTDLPVIGVPLASSSLGGIDSLLSTAQMPAGVPVACMGIGAAGARNAALLALRILALRQPALRKELRAYVQAQKERVAEDDARARQGL